MSEKSIPTQALLAWYDAEGRQLPWRVKPGGPSSETAPPARADPYHVWISEILLQQTTVTMATPYYERIVTRWPTVNHLAQASLDDILVALQGIGYYRRVHALHACGQLIQQNYGGIFPSDPLILQRLPGIGPYTAAAIAAIAFDVPAVAVDGNIARVLSRYWGLSSWGTNLLRELQQRCYPFLPQRVGDYTQALMDLGSSCCTHRHPHCYRCPLASGCFAFKHSDPLAFPCKPDKKNVPQRQGWAVWGQNEKGAVWIIRRNHESLLKKLFFVPSSSWLAHLPDLPKSRPQWKILPQKIKHVFTHFKLTLTVVVAPGNEVSALYPQGFWLERDDIPNYPFPRLFTKLVDVMMTSESPLL